MADEKTMQEQDTFEQSLIDEPIISQQSGGDVFNNLVSQVLADQGRVAPPNPVTSITKGLGNFSADPTALALAKNRVGAAAPLSALGTASKAFTEAFERSREQRTGGMDLDTLSKLSTLRSGQGQEQQRQISQITNLRNQLLKDPNAKDYVEMVNKYNKVITSARQGTAAGDVSLVFAYMKILDPTSVVREGEQATARNATGVPQRVKNMYNYLLAGNTMDATQRADFVKTANDLVETGKVGYDQAKKGITDIANRYGIDANLVITPFEKAKTQYNPDEVFSTKDRPQGERTFNTSKGNLTEEQLRKMYYAIPDNQDASEQEFQTYLNSLGG